MTIFLDRETEKITTEVLSQDGHWNEEFQRLEFRKFPFTPIEKARIRCGGRPKIYIRKADLKAEEAFRARGTVLMSMPDVPTQPPSMPTPIPATAY